MPTLKQQILTILKKNKSEHDYTGPYPLNHEEKAQEIKIVCEEYLEKKSQEIMKSSII